MSCYLRHLKDIFEESGIEVTPASKKEIDRLLHGLAGVEYKNCSPAWQAIKEQIRGDEAARTAFVERLKVAVRGL
ncbi:MAG: hypothetical protein ACYDA8_06045 [Deferrisomatales bacterium]